MTLVSFILLPEPSPKVSTLTPMLEEHHEFELTTETLIVNVNSFLEVLNHIDLEEILSKN